MVFHAFLVLVREDPPGNREAVDHFRRNSCLKKRRKQLIILCLFGDAESPSQWSVGAEIYAIACKDLAFRGQIPKNPRGERAHSKTEKWQKGAIQWGNVSIDLR